MLTPDRCRNTWYVAARLTNSLASSALAAPEGPNFGISIRLIATLKTNVPAVTTKSGRYRSILKLA